MILLQEQVSIKYEQRSIILQRTTLIKDFLDTCVTTGGEGGRKNKDQEINLDC